MIFAVNDFVELSDGTTCKVVSILGGGAQGKVYKVNYSNRFYALKMYHARICALPNNSLFKQNLENNIKTGPVSNRFIWPLKLTKTFDDGSYGYLMNLIPSGYECFSKFITGIKMGSAPYDFYFSGLISIACRIVFEYQKLWGKSLCFQDLNEGSIFINPYTWDILICDCDNVAPNKQQVFVKGMPGYMAPEVYTDKESPNYYSDLHSIGVIVFMLLFGGAHPFFGKESRRLSFEEPEQYGLKTYGTNPIYVMDPNNEINRPQKGVDDLLLTIYPFYPNYVKDLFVKMFVGGVKDPTKRPNENELLNMLGDMYNDLVFCVNCDRPLFSKYISGDDAKISCSNCGHEVDNVIFFENKYNSIAVTNFKRLYNWQITGEYPTQDDAFQIVGIFEKNNEGIYKITNNSNEKWTLELGDQKREVERDKSVLLKNKAIRLFIKGSEFIVKER